MHLIQTQVNLLRSQSLTQLEAWGDPLEPRAESPNVGHIYQIQFNAWTYVKSNLWASLMQEVFFELNRQISLEQQLGKVLSSEHKSANEKLAKASPSLQKDLIALNTKYGEVLRQGGKLWHALYLISEEARNTLLTNELGLTKFNEWQQLISETEVSNYLWHTLNRLQKTKRQQLKESEKQLQVKEKELQRSLTKAEIDVDRQLSRQVKAAVWNPLINIILKRQFTDEQIENFAASGETLARLRETIQSWQGLLALFLLGLLLVLTFRPEGLPNLLTQLFEFIEQEELLEAGKRWITILVR